MYKLTLVLLFALSSLVFAIPQQVTDKIDELGKRGGAFYGIVCTCDISFPSDSFMMPTLPSR